MSENINSTDCLDMGNYEQCPEGTGEELDRLQELVRADSIRIAALEGLLKEWLRTCPVERTLYAEGLARRTESLLTTEGKEE